MNSYLIHIVYKSLIPPQYDSLISSCPCHAHSEILQHNPGRCAPNSKCVGCFSPIPPKLVVRLVTRYDSLAGIPYPLSLLDRFPLSWETLSCAIPTA